MPLTHPCSLVGLSPVPGPVARFCDLARPLILLAGVMAWPVAGLAAAATAVSFAGGDVELVLSSVGDQAVRIELLPIDDNGQPISTPASNVLVPLPSREVLRTRMLDGETALVAGSLHVTVSNHPLTVVARRGDGSAVQRLVFDDAAVHFDTAAPVFGLGEGARQFDRRGARFTMEPTWGEQRRPYRGSVVPSPYLIGTDGWALFVHHPEGQFDLHETRGGWRVHAL